MFILIYFVIVFLVVEISTVLLVYTGLEKEVSRFQALSLLTGTGYTTKEAELILRHPLRRKIGGFLILFGAFSLAVVISALSNILAERSGLRTIGIAAVVLALLLALLKMRRIRIPLIGKLHDHLQQDFEPSELPVQETMYLSEDDLYTIIHLYEGSSCVGSRADSIFPASEDIQLLYLQRGDVKIRMGRLEEELASGDMLHLYGNKETIERKFRDEINRLKEQTENESKVIGLEE
ncbi:potassium transporter TrkA [Paenibacillus sp. J31TS4]|uniref:hypothetical protein n=1 Tax=Paenibacillus sp. J31TS4 TaxID=2807195 RepID=UPI001B11A812|nr:hypothetical protein [Paenibacillus sp. J31TS4]GIP38754.1 potassium transporter TrkA [Paenibacillus sp. J31TS4]